MRSGLYGSHFGTVCARRAEAMDVMFRNSGIGAIAAVAIMSVTSSVAAADTTPASFGNGSHLYDYLYGDRTSHEARGGAEDGWSQMIELFNAVAFNTGSGGHTEPRSQRTRRQAFSQPGRGGRDLNSLFDYPGQNGHGLPKTHRQEQDEEEEEEEAEREESLPFMGDVAFAFPLVILDIPFTGIEIPMFDYDSRNYYDSVK